MNSPKALCIILLKISNTADSSVEVDASTQYEVDNDDTQSTDVTINYSCDKAVQHTPDSVDGSTQYNTVLQLMWQFSVLKNYHVLQFSALYM